MTTGSVLTRAAPSPTPISDLALSRKSSKSAPRSVCTALLTFMESVEEGATEVVAVVAAVGAAAALAAESRAAPWPAA